MRAASNSFGALGQNPALWLRQNAAIWLVQGITPRRLALTLSLGFVLGFNPIFGISTGLCILVALAFRLNQPAIQLANYAAMPFQLALMVPFMRLGGKLTPSLSQQSLDLAALAHSPWQMLQHSSTKMATQLTIMAGQALLAWMLIAIPVVLVLTYALTMLLRRVPGLATPALVPATRTSATLNTATLNAATLNAAVLTSSHADLRQSDLRQAG